ncbi:MAG: RsmB/NOP family class I SAM-dependent RNA methyltransferase [Pseudomonadota bacterium]
MTPAARLSAAMALLDAFAAPDETPMMDGLLARWARANRYAGSKDRAAIADLVYQALRRWRAGERLGSTGRARLLGALRADGASVEALSALCDGSRYGPQPLRSDEAAGLASWRAEDAPIEWPEWLWPELARSVADPAAEAAAQTVRAPVDLRVNASKATVRRAAERLAEEGIATEPAPLSPWALRLAGPARVERGSVFAEGWVEIQDAASQAVALLAGGLAPDREGVVILDACAGGGGKSLALAAARPDARILAYDVEPRRMADLAPRAARAGARIERLDAARLERWAGRCDLALVDAPCSGSGAWARNPDAKWRLTPDRFAALQSAQRSALRLGAEAIAPGGVLVYATCSLLRAENEDVCAEALQTLPGATPIALAEAWARARLAGSPSMACEARFSPATTQTDGFYATALRL